LRQSHDVYGSVKATMKSLDATLSALLASGKSAEAILSEIMSEVEKVLPFQLEPARDLIVEFLLEKAMTNQWPSAAPPIHGNVVNFLAARSRRGNR
jgi:hypothetical protein